MNASDMFFNSKLQNVEIVIIKMIMCIRIIVIIVIVQKVVLISKGSVLVATFIDQMYEKLILMS